VSTVIKQENVIKYIDNQFKDLIILETMTTTNIILSGLFYLIPGNLEIINNDSLSGVYDDIKHKRDTLFIFGCSTLVYSLLPFKIIKLFMGGLCVYSIIVYFRTIKRWQRYL
jgi:hypothetical protein